MIVTILQGMAGQDVLEVEMQIVKKQLDYINGLIGVQNFDIRVEYKRSLYVISEIKGEEEVLFNTLTGEIVKTKDLSVDMNKLVQKWFYIPKSVEEYSLYYLFKNVYAARYPRKRFGPLEHVVVFTTLACNANCPYCYEKDGRKMESMSKNTALDVASWIARSSKNIKVQWFGGEPLMNIDAIETVSGELNRLGASYQSTMITNGLLLQDLTREQVERWRLKSVQVTLDGTAETHERAKGLDRGAFEKTISGISNMVNLGVLVTVRINVAKNSEDAIRLVDYLHQKFEKQIKVYAAGVDFEFSDDFMLVRDYIYTLYEYKYKVPEYKRTHCMADNGRSCCISPSGKLSVCEHFSDAEIYGDIYHEEYDQKVLNDWAKLEDTENCKKCSVRPVCNKLVKCPTQRECTQQTVERQISDIRRMLRRL